MKHFSLAQVLLLASSMRLHCLHLALLLALASALGNAPFADADESPIGWLDTADATGVSGWAHDPDAGTTPIDVHLYVDGAFRAVVKADQRRDDLVYAGVAPNAEHGFWCNLAGLAPGDHTVAVYAINFGGPGGNPPLAGSPKTVTVAEVVPMGFLDSADGTQVAGWAFDPDAGNGGRDPIWVHIYVDGRYQDQVLANLRRDDLVTAGVAPNPEHGFVLALPSLPWGTHRIDAFAINATPGFNPPLGATPRYVKVLGAGTFHGWNPGLSFRRIANFNPVGEPATYFESCPDTPSGCYPAIPSGGGFYTLAPDVGSISPQPCETNAGAPFWAGPSAGMQPCPLFFRWEDTVDGRPVAVVTTDTRAWTTSVTPNVYLGFQENVPYSPYYFGGQNHATSDDALVSVRLAGSYVIPPHAGNHSKVRFLVGTSWYVPAAGMSVVLELNLDAVTHEEVEQWSTTARAVRNPYCPAEVICLYLGGRYWGFPSVLGASRSIVANWTEIARALEASGELQLRDAAGSPVSALGPYAMSFHMGPEILGNVSASLKVSGFRQLAH